MTGKLSPEDSPQQILPGLGSWFGLGLGWGDYIPGDNIPENNFPSTIKTVYWFSAEWETSNFLTIGTLSLS